MKHIAYIAAIFPKGSETFLQREAEALLQKGYNVKIYSLWGGKDHWKNQEIRRIKKWEILKLSYLWPYYLLKNPQAFISISECMLTRPIQAWIWAGENFWGIASAIILAREIEKSEVDHLHGVWAALPASCAWLLSKLTKKNFSFGAHAYDVFQFDGDWLIQDKAKDASFIQTSSLATQSRLLALGIPKKKILLQRRGMLELPQFKAKKIAKNTIKLLSVGRLVPKKAYPFMLEVAKELQSRNLDFELKILGDGDLYKTLKKQINQLQLNEQVHLMGACPNEKVLEELQESDLFLFTGEIARDGDRDGLPNVVPESMATGTPVIVSSVGALPEIIKNKKNGILIEERDPLIWAEKIEEVLKNPELYQNIAVEARSWVEENFNNHKNIIQLSQRIEELGTDYNTVSQFKPQINADLSSTEHSENRKNT